MGVWPIEIGKIISHHGNTMSGEEQLRTRCFLRRSNLELVTIPADQAASMLNAEDATNETIRDSSAGSQVLRWGVSARCNLHQLRLRRTGLLLEVLTGIGRCQSSHKRIPQKLLTAAATTTQNSQPHLCLCSLILSRTQLTRPLPSGSSLVSKARRVVLTIFAEGAIVVEVDLI
jgi:hypothetical protein